MTEAVKSQQDALETDEEASERHIKDKVKEIEAEAKEKVEKAN